MINGDFLLRKAPVTMEEWEEFFEKEVTTNLLKFCETIPFRHFTLSQCYLQCEVIAKKSFSEEIHHCHEWDPRGIFGIDFKDVCPAHEETEKTLPVWGYSILSGHKEGHWIEGGITICRRNEPPVYSRISFGFKGSSIKDILSRHHPLAVLEGFQTEMGDILFKMKCLAKEFKETVVLPLSDISLRAQKIPRE